MENKVKISILDFLPYYPPHVGGLERYAYEIHQNLSQNGCRITVFVPHIPKNSPEEETDGNVTIIRYPAFEIIPAYPLPCFWRCKFWQKWGKIKKEKYDIVFSVTRFFVQPIMALVYAKMKKIPILHIEHGSDFVKHKFPVSLIAKIFDKTIGFFILSQADRIIAPSKSATRFIKILCHRDAPLIYRGMPFSEIDSIAPKEELRKELGNKKMIIYTGRLIHGKGISHLIEAISQINRPDIVLFIVGEGPERKNLEEYAKKNKLEKQIRFTEGIPFQEVIGLLKISDIFVNPSYNEGLPTSVLEAGACQRAIVATKVGGTEEIVTNGESAIIIPPCDTDAIRNALEKLLDNENERNRLGINARKEIEQKFKWENTTEAYLKEIEALIRHRY
jgi:glycosyltransferase involved in cell wall biosynthesis